MKFYITNYSNSRLMFNILNRFGYEIDEIKNYKGEHAYYIISTDEVRNENWMDGIASTNNLIFLLDDGCEGYAQKLRLEYTKFYEILDEFSIDRNRGIICYNNAYNRGLIKYDEVGMNMLYIPIFALWPFSEWKDVKTNIIPEYDYSYLVRNGRKHKKEGYLKIKEKQLKNVFITYKKNLGETDDTIFNDEADGLLDEFKFHLKPEVYLNSKINITAESEYYPHKVLERPNYFEEILHLSEKTWRNISYGLPFTLLSSKNSLKEIRRLGFKTFDSLIDESYDEMDDSVRIEHSINAAVELLKFYGTNELNSILEFNKSRIYDDTIMKNILETESLSILREYVNNLDI